MRQIFPILLLLLITACSSTEKQEPHTNAPAIGESMEMVFATPDGLALHGWFQRHAETPAPLIVMLPMLGTTHESYDKLVTTMTTDTTIIDSLAIPACQFLSLDLRGHGKSTIRAKDTLQYRDMSAEEFANMPSDVASAIDSVLSVFGDSIDSTRVYVVGASIGANTAVMATQFTSAIDRVVLLSPGNDYRGLKPAEAFGRFAGHTLILAARGDQYSYASCQQLMKVKMSGWVLKAYSGNEHGTNLINANGQARHDMLAWLFGDINGGN